MQFRAMTIEDIPALAEIDALSNRPAWTSNMFRKELDLPFSLQVVASEKEMPIGFGVIWILDDSAQLIQLAVSPKHRRCGVGQQLLKTLMDSARERGCKKMELEFREENSAARSLYEKMACRRVGKRKKLYTDADGILMECAL